MIICCPKDGGPSQLICRVDQVSVFCPGGGGVWKNPIHPRWRGLKKSRPPPSLSIFFWNGPQS